MLLVVALSVPAVEAAGVRPAPLAGAVEDTTGVLLEGVEILVVSAGTSVQPLAVLRSDPAGRFGTAALAPGTYRLAALKQGYLTWVGQIDTRVKNWIDVVLRPAPTAAAAGRTLPEDPAWTLRLPRRSIFRETDGTAMLTDDDLPERAGTEAGPLPVSMQVDQLFAVGPGSTETELRGSETTVNVDGAFGDRGRIRVRGQHAEVDAGDAELSPTSAARTDSSQWNVDFAFDTGTESRVELEAWYGAENLALGRVGVPLSQARQAWGYRSSWQTLLDDRSRVAVRMDYDDRSFDLGAAFAGLGHSSDGRLANRTVEASGSYERLVSDDHGFQVGFTARRSERPELVGLSGDPVVDSFATRAGWSFELEAEDHWNVSAPFTLVYGLGYRHSLGETDASWVTPSLGAGWSVDAVDLRFVVSYHSILRWNEATPTLPQPKIPLPTIRSRSPSYEPEDRIGYSASIELPLAEGVRLTGTASSSPLELDGSRPIGGAGIDAVPLYVSDGPAAIDEARVTLVEARGATRTYFEIARGRTTGTLLSWDAPLLAFGGLQPTSLTYLDGRWGLILPIGTDFEVLYRRVGRTGGNGLRGLPEQTSVEFRVGQELMRLKDLGTWRLLMAVRMAETSENDEPVPIEDYALLDALSGGVRAGLSVSF